jgi:hypothetical protein
MFLLNDKNLGLSTNRHVVNIEYKINKHIVKIVIPIANTFQLIDKNYRFGIEYDYIYGFYMFKTSKKPWTIISDDKND